MDKVTAELPKGSKYDPIILLVGIVIIVGGFLTMYETDFWGSSNNLWQPITSIGAIILVVNYFSRFFRPKLRIELLKNSSESIIIHPVQKVLFSGWLKKSPLNLTKSYFKSFKSFHIGGSAISAPGIPVAEGNHWVCFEFADRSIIEFHLPNYETVKNICSFVQTNLPNVEVITDENI
jgi:hypothetical protein